MVTWSRSYRFIDLTVLFELGAKRGVVGVPCKATAVASDLIAVQKDMSDGLTQ